MSRPSLSSFVSTSASSSSSSLTTSLGSTAPCRRRQPGRQVPKRWPSARPVWGLLVLGFWVQNADAWHLSGGPYTKTPGGPYLNIPHLAGGASNATLLSETAKNKLNFQQTFRKWTTLCDVPLDSYGNGRYFIHVQTNSPYPDVGAGRNSFSLRGSFNGGTPTTGVVIHGQGAMSVFANIADASNPPSFYLARVIPTGESRLLTLRFFDIGDTNTTGSLNVVADSAVTCSWFIEGNGGAPAGPTTTGCTLPLGGADSAAYNDHWVNMKVSIPAGYTCVNSQNDACWVRGISNFSVAAGTWVRDASTWTARLTGGPPRLVDPSRPGSASQTLGQRRPVRPNVASAATARHSQPARNAFALDPARSK
jgi:hypothetical protein